MSFATEDIFEVMADLITEHGGDPLHHFRGRDWKLDGGTVFRRSVPWASPSRRQRATTVVASPRVRRRRVPRPWRPGASKAALYMRVGASAAEVWAWGFRHKPTGFDGFPDLFRATYALRVLRLAGYGHLVPALIARAFPSLTLLAVYRAASAHEAQGAAA